MEAWKTKKYKSKWLMPYDDRFTVRTGLEWFNRYMLRPDERPDYFEEVNNGSKM
jgi:hypothetical protein